MAAIPPAAYQSRPETIRDYLNGLGCSTYEIEAFFVIAEVDLDNELPLLSATKIGQTVGERLGEESLSRDQIRPHLKKLQQRRLIYRPPRTEGLHMQKAAWGYWYLTETGKRLALAGPAQERPEPQTPTISPWKMKRWWASVGVAILAVFLAVSFLYGPASHILGDKLLVVLPSNVDGRMDFPVLCHLYDENFEPVRASLDSGSDGACRWQGLPFGLYHIQVHKTARVDPEAVETEFWGESRFWSPGSYEFRRNSPFGYLAQVEEGAENVTALRQSIIVENPSWADRSLMVRVLCIWDDDQRAPYLYTIQHQGIQLDVGNHAEFPCEYDGLPSQVGGIRFGYVVHTRFAQWLTTDSWWTGLTV